MTRAAIYCRVSTRAQEGDGSSLTTQEDRCRQYAAERGYTVLEEHVYQEIYSGVELWERPMLTRLRDAIRRQAIDVVVAFAIDRLARDPVHLGVILSEADHKRVAVEFVSETLDDSPEGQLIRFVRGYAAKVEHEKIRERSIRGKLARVQSGKLLAGMPELYGYRLDRERGVRTIDEPEASIVRLIFTWYTEEGIALADIARRLNQQGVSPPATKRTYQRETSGLWAQQTIRNIVRHEAYVGESWAWKWTGKSGPVLRPREEWIALPEGTTPPIVTRGQWEIAQRKLAQNRGERARNKERPALLRGLIFCSVCGRRMWVDCYHQRLYYRCPARQVDGARCGSVIVQAAPVDAWAWDLARTRILDPDLLEREWQERAQQRNGRVDEDLAGLRRRLSQIVRGQERILASYSESESIPWELVEAQIQRAEAEKAEIRQQLTEIERRQAGDTAIRKRILSLQQICERAAANLDSMSFEERRRMLEVLGLRVLASGFEYTPVFDPQEL
jgi:site-specific DNA recombinase